MEESTLSVAERINRQKLLTRARGLFLDHGIYHLGDLQNYDLSSIKGLGPKGLAIIDNVVNNGTPDELDYLFPYPFGIEDDEAYTITPEGRAYLDSLPEAPDEVTTDEVPSEGFRSIPTNFVVYAIGQLYNQGRDWVAGYLAGLVELTEGFPGLVCEAEEIAAQSYQPPGRAWWEIRADLECESSAFNSTCPEPAPAQGDYEPAEKGGC
jgi:hypothetical protein